jgi:tetratricopeptide (TPR) repeat protein
MTSTAAPAAEPQASFGERLGILMEELELAVKWQRPCLVLVVYSSEYVRADVEAALENELVDLGQQSASLSVKGRDPNGLVSFFKEFRDPARTVFLIDGLRWGNGDDCSAYATVSLQREFFVERQVRAVIWMTPNEISKLMHAVPDFWAYRDRVVDFAESPKAEQVLKGALDSAWQGTGEYAVEDGNTDSKISLRETMLTELPEGSETLSIRGNLFLTLAVLHWRKGDYEKADGQLQEALQIATRIQDNWFEAECFNALALIRSSTQQTDAAIDAYKQALLLAPNQIFVWNNLGNLCAKVGRNDEAMIAFRKSLEGNAKDAVAWNGLASVHFKLGYVDDAIAAYRRALQFSPTYPQPWCGLGDVYASIGRTDEALKCYHAAIRLNSKYIAPWVRLGALFGKQERFRDAVKAYQKALLVDGQDSLVWNELGNALMKCESFEEAEAALSRAIALDRANGWAYSNLAQAKMQLGRSKEAVSLLLRSIELMERAPDKAVSWNRLADVYRSLNDYDNAVAAYQMADRLTRGGAAIEIEPSALAENAEAAGPAAQEAATWTPEAALTMEDTRPTRASIQKPQAESVPEVGRQEEPAAAAKPENQKQAKAAAPTSLYGNGGQGPAKSKDAKADELHTRPENREAAVNSDPKASSQQVSGSTQQGAPSSEPQRRPHAEDAVKWTAQGNAHFRRGALEQAVVAFNKAIQIDSGYGVPYSNLALTYVTQGQFAEAILLYQKSIELLETDRDRALSWNGLGNAYRCVGDYSNAVAAYQKAAELDPETGGIRDQADNFQPKGSQRTARGWNDLGELLLKTGALDKAHEAFRKAIEMEPDFGRAYCNLARTRAAEAKYSEAIPYYERGIALLETNKEKADAWNGLGNAYRKMNDYNKAINAYQKAVVLADEGVDLLTRTRFSLLSNVYVNQ